MLNCDIEISGGSPYDIVANVLDCDIVISGGDQSL